MKEIGFKIPQKESENNIISSDETKSEFIEEYKINHYKEQVKFIKELQDLLMKYKSMLNEEQYYAVWNKSILSKKIGIYSIDSDLEFNIHDLILFLSENVLKLDILE